MFNYKRGKYMIPLEERIDKIIFGLKRKGEIEEEEIINIKGLIDNVKYSEELFNIKEKIVKESRKVYYVESNEEKIMLRLINDYLKTKRDVYSIDRKTQIKLLLNELTSKNKRIIKFDIKDYYNSINVEQLEEIVFKNDNIYETEYINILKRYINTAKKKGTILPGLSPSNILSEVLGKEIDKEIKKNLIKDNINFKYFRYVDDILIIIKSEEKEEYDYEKKISSVLEEHFSLTFNDEKTQLLDLESSFDNLKFKYLGYEFYFKKIDGKTKWEIGVAEEKVEKIKVKLEDVSAFYLKNIQTTDNLHDLDKWYYENLKNIFYYKVYRGYNGVYYTGFSYNYNELYNDFGFKENKENLEEINKTLKKTFDKRKVLKNVPFYKLLKVEEFIEKKKKMIFIDEKNYMNKRKMIKHIELHNKINSIDPIELQNKTYFEITQEYKNCFKKRV